MTAKFARLAKIRLSTAIEVAALVALLPLGYFDRPDLAYAVLVLGVIGAVVVGVREENRS